MIKIHRWTCVNCKKEGKTTYKWFLRVETDNELDKIRLGEFEKAVSLHVIEFQHEVNHNEKGDTVFKFA